MTGNDLTRFLAKYLAEFPKMVDNDIIVTTPRKRRDKQGDWYHRFKITSIGMNALVGKDNLELGVEPIS